MALGWQPLDPRAVVALLRPSGSRWWFSGGVAIDLWLGETTRSHGDIDVSVAREDWPAVRAAVVRRCEIHAAVEGHLVRLGPNTTTEAAHHNLWVREHAGPWCLQINLEPVAAGRWSYRRDPRISRPLSEVVVRIGGLPVVNPAVQLLWKAKDPRPEDDADRAVVVPRLSSAERRWLRAAIRTAHPSSPWAELRTAGAGGSR